MKNTLLTTTALALTSLASTASAVEVVAGPVNLSINGSFATTAAISSANIGAGSNNAGADYDGLDILTTSEIHFRPSITLDNGITIGADVELEGNTTDDQIDESTIFAKGGFGHIEFGSKDSAGKLMQVGAPDKSLVYAVSSSLTAFVPFSAPAKGDFANDADRLTYFTPDFGGFQFGVSYARNNSQTNGAVNNNEDGIGTDYADIGIAYNGTVGDVAVGFSARYGTYDRAIHTVNAAMAATATTAAATATTAAATATTAAATATTTAVTDTTAAAALPTSNDTERTAAATATTTAATATTAAATATTAAATATTAAATATTAAATATTATAGAHPTIAGVGLSLGFGGGVSIGGGYVERDNKDGMSEIKTYDIGVGYVNGPMAYSLTYVHDEQTGVSENELWVAAATYAVNDNFNVGASLSAFDTDAAGGPVGDIDGTIFALSASFNF